MSPENIFGILMSKPNKNVTASYSFWSFDFKHSQLVFDIKTPEDNWLILPKNLNKSHGVMHAVTAR